MKKNRRSFVIQALYLVFLLFPLMICVLNLLCPKININNMRRLNGVAVQYDFPKLTLASFTSGDFQNSFSQWWEINYGGRPIIVSVFSQIEYSLLRKSPDTNSVIGKNREFFRMDDISSYLGLENNYRIDNNKKKMIEYVEHLQHLNEKLGKRNKFLIFYLTPDKSDFLRESIPERYYWRADDSVLNAADCLIDLLSDSGIEYIDTRELLRDYKYPVFYITGAHWSGVSEQEMTVNLLETIMRISGKKGKKLVLGDIITQPDPYFRDADALQTQNLFFAKKDLEYYYHNEYIEDSKCDSISVMVSGGSFCDGFSMAVMRHNLFCDGELVFTSYDKVVSTQDKDGVVDATYIDGDFSKYDYLSCVEKIDGVIIEENSGSGVNLFSCGLVEYLDGILE